eukprot:g36465.t1
MRAAKERTSASKVLDVVLPAEVFFYDGQKAHLSLATQMQILPLGGLISSHSSTGFVVRARQESGQDIPLLICNSHSVTQTINVTIRFSDSVVNYTCRVWAVSHELDLALLYMLNEECKEVGSQMFRGKGLELVAEQSLPGGGRKMRILGYPTGSERLSTTDWVVSRCATCCNTHGLAQVPTIQTNAAINSGNSGGPALDPDTGRVLVVAFEGVALAQNLGYCIPAKLMQTTENAGLRCSLGLCKDEQRGLLVCKVFPLAKKLQEGDVILKVNGRDIQRDGTYREGGYSYWWTNALLPKHVGDKVEVMVERERRPMSLQVTLASEQEFYRCSPTYYRRKIQYFCFGGLVFTSSGRPQKSEKNLPPVTLLYIFSHESTQGYEACRYLLVTQVDDTPVTGLLQLWKLLQTKLRRQSEGYVIFVLGKDEQNKRRLVLSMAGLKARGARILKENSVTEPHYLLGAVGN